MRLLSDLRYIQHSWLGKLILQQVTGGHILQGGEGHGEAASLVSHLLIPQVSLPRWSAVHHYWEGRVVLDGEGEQLLVPGVLLMAGPSWSLGWDQLKPVPEQAESCTDEK